MSGGPDQTAGTVELSTRQLEDRLQLTMAVHAQIEKTGTVHRDQMRVAMESIGLELPAEMPLNSFTQQPSSLNLAQTKHILSVHQENALVALVGSFKRDLKRTLEKINEYRYRSHEDLSVKLNRLQIEGYRYEDFDIASVAGREEAPIKAEHDHVTEMMARWEKLGQLGVDCICPFAGLRREAERLLVHVNEVIDRKLVFDREGEAEAFVNRLGQLGIKVSSAQHSEVENMLPVDGLIKAVVEAGQHYEGPLAPRVRSLDLDVEELTEQYVLEGHLTRVASAIQDYLHYCWRLDDAFAQATNSASQAATSLYYLSTLTA